MYSLPKDFDESVFVGRELEQIAFTANTALFSFGEDLSVNLESSFTLRDQPLDAVEKQSIPVKSSRVMRLIGTRVSSAKASANGDIMLTFEDGSQLEFRNDSKHYESYALRIGRREIFV